MNISLIITTFNRPSALRLVLESVLTQTKLPYEIVIADDGSAPNTAFQISQFIQKSPITVYHSWQENLGFRAARSRNLAIAKSRGDYVIMVDGDMVLHPKFIESHIKFAQKGVFLQGGRTLINEEKTETLLNQRSAIKLNFFSSGIVNRKNTIHSFVLEKLFAKKNSSFDGIRTCNFSLWKEDAVQVNGFNEDFEGWGREDSEFAVRLINNDVERRDLKFCALAYHLYHTSDEEASTLQANDRILETSITSKRTSCKNGINLHL